MVSAALVGVPGVVADRPNPKLGVTAWKPDSTTLTVWYWIDLATTSELVAGDAALSAVRDGLRAAGLEPVQLAAAAPHPDAAGGVPRGA